MVTSDQSLIVARFKAFSHFAGLATIVVSCVVILGWLTDVEMLKRLIPGHVPIRSTTAIAFLLSGASLSLLNRTDTRFWLQGVGRILALAVAAAGAATLVEDVSGLYFGLDTVLYSPKPDSPGISFPGPMPLNISLSFLLVGIALSIWRLNWNFLWQICQVCTLIAGLISAMTVIGHTYGLPSLCTIGGCIEMPLAVALIYIMLCLGMLLAVPERGITSVLTRDTIGGLVARRFSLGIFTIPLVVGWLRAIGERASLYDSAFGLAMLVVLIVVLFACFVGWTARAIDDIDAARQQAKKALEHSGYEKELILDCAGEGIYGTDTEGNLTFINMSAAQLTNWQATEVIGKNPHEIWHHTKADGSDYSWQECPHMHSLKHGTAHHIHEELFWRKDGTSFWVEYECRPILSEGRIVGAVTTFSDISERKRAEENQKRMLELARSNVELQQFAFVASHDLQEPLRAIKGYLELLSRRYKGKLDDEAETFIASAVDSTMRMQALISDLLNYARVETKGKEFTLTDLSKALDQALNNLRIAIEESGATVIQQGLPVVMADDSQIAQLFQNLIGNAIKFRKKEEIPRVEVSATEIDSEWQIAVRDQGIGMDMAHAERIFAIFKRLHTRTEYAGTGIGLAICKKIVERHGGRIWVESEPGSGSTFFFTVPRST